MSDRDPHDGWTPQPEEQVQPGDPWRDPPTSATGRVLALDSTPVARNSPDQLPVGALLAAALMAANIPCDSGEDVDRLIAEMWTRGLRVVAAATEPNETP